MARWRVEVLTLLPNVAKCQAAGEIGAEHVRVNQRSHIAETQFGHAKHNLGFHRFTGGGLA